jgi:3-oxoacyl-[acyl-carrier protein] reductase
MTDKLDGRVALVSGSGRGIGREIALKLASEGARLVINDLDADPANETAEAIRAAGGEAVVCAGSVTEDGFAERFINTGVESFGGLDIIVNNAGYTWDSVVQKMTDEQWQAIIDVHMTAPFRILRAAQPVISAKAKEEAAAGREVFRKVVNISSIAGTRGIPEHGSYGASKWAVRGITRTVALELGKYNINVNAVCPGIVETPRMSKLCEAKAKVRGWTVEQVYDEYVQEMALKRVTTPQDVANAVLFMASDDARNITGQELAVDGGWDV